jgi:hypothetical protein
VKAVKNTHQTQQMHLLNFRDSNDVLAALKAKMEKSEKK